MGRMCLAELMSSLVFDGEFRSVLGIQEHSFPEGSTDYNTVLQVFGRTDANQNDALEQAEFISFCSQLCAALKQAAAAPDRGQDPVMGEASAQQPEYGSRWQIDLQYRELENAMAETCTIAELRTPAKQASEVWLLQSRAERAVLLPVTAEQLLRVSLAGS